MNNTSSRPSLTVCLITYNHVEYIRDALEGILMQVTDFSWELVIADDCSTDETREILQEYKEKYPNLIRLLLQEKNVGPAQNWLDLIAAADTEYVAYQEGDDFWTDKEKLQKQYDFLQENPECMACGTNSITRAPYGDFIFRKRMDARKRHYLHDLIKGNPIQTCTIVFRNCGELPEYFKSIHSGDMHLYWYLARSGGYIANIPRVTSIYRFHGQGRHSGVKKAKVALNGLRDRFVFLEHNYSRSLHFTVLKTYLSFSLISTIRFLLRRPGAGFGVVKSHYLASFIVLKTLFDRKGVARFISRHR